MIYLARHTETVYNAAHRAQGAKVSSPLSKLGIAQAVAIGVALHRHLGTTPDIEIWSSPSSRTQQTSAIIAEHLSHSYFDVKMDPRLIEIGLGDWEGHFYHEIEKTHGPIFDPVERFFTRQAPGGEWYPQIAERLLQWLDELNPVRPAVVISHGITTRVLRGLLVDNDAPNVAGVTIARDAPQGTVFKIIGRSESVIHVGGEEIA